MRFIGVAAAIAAWAASVSCGDVVRQGRSPVLLVVSSIADGSGKSPVMSDVDDGFNNPGQAVLSATMKNVSLEPTPNNQVIINRYHVEFTRADGRNVQGVDVPYAFDGAVTATVAPLANTTVPFDLVRNAAKHEAPLTQIVSGGTVLSTIATVTFYGQDVVGNSISASGTITVNFGNFQ
jgi:hypothetical protein